MYGQQEKYFIRLQPISNLTSRGDGYVMLEVLKLKRGAHKEFSSSKETKYYNIRNM